MASLLSGQNISKSYYSKQLFSDLNLTVGEKDKIALLGPNGAGKSTLLKIIAGSEDYDEGDFTKKRLVKVSYVEQDSNFSDAKPGETLESYATRKASDLGLDQTSAIVEASTSLSLCNFEDFTREIDSLSGGEKKRLSIGLSLISKPDLILLDEPTNHLDIEGILWLEKFLQRAKFSYITISHDRYFLKNVCQKFWELNKIYPNGILEKVGTYDDFLEHKELFFREQQNQIDSIQSKLRKEEEWLSRMPKARTTKAKFRVEATKELQRTLTEIRTRLRSQSASIEFSGSGRKTKCLIKISNLSKSFEDKVVIEDFNLEVTNGARIGILGKNGSGKSTFLKLIAEQMSPDVGEIKKADNLSIAYFEQSKDALNPEWTLKRALCEESDHVNFRGSSIHVASWGMKFNFAASQLDTQIKDLSGGEKARVYIARMMLIEADVLILDEPTNDLDIETLEILEDALKTFKGTILIVSHDRYLLSSICSTYFGLDGKGHALEFASYDQWQKTIDTQPGKSTKELASKPSAPVAKPQQKKKLSYKYQLEFDKMEETIAEAEEGLSKLQEEASKPENATNFMLQQELGDKIQASEDQIKKLYERWSELEDMQS